MQTGSRSRHRQRHLVELSGRRSIQFSRDLATTSVSLTRGGPLMGRGPGWTDQRQRRQSRQLAHASQRQRRFIRPTTMARRCEARHRARSRCGRVRAGSSRCRRSTIASPSRSSTSARCPAAVPSHLRQPLRVRVHRSQHDVDGVPARPDVAAGPQSRRLRGAVRGIRALLRLRRAARARAAASG